MCLGCAFLFLFLCFLFDSSICVSALRGGKKSQNGNLIVSPQIRVVVWEIPGSQLMLPAAIHLAELQLLQQMRLDSHLPTSSPLWLLSPNTCQTSGYRHRVHWKAPQCGPLWPVQAWWLPPCLGSAGVSAEGMGGGWPWVPGTSRRLCRREIWGDGPGVHNEV